ncbi:putative laccase-5 [Hordeum vulgare]|nr:putative laccase-5 [Hordeum vulgare]
MCTIMERSVREVAEDAARNRRELEIEQIFLEQGVTASQASASKEAELRVLKAEQEKIWLDLNSDEDSAPPAPPPRRRRRTRGFW